MKIRVLTFLLAMLMIAALFGCGKDEKKDDQTTESSVAESETEQTVELPKLNREVNMCIGGGGEEILWISEDTSTVISNAVYHKNISIENTLNCILNISYEPVVWNTRNEFYTKVSTAVMNDEHLYDVVAAYSPLPPQMVVNGLMQRMDTLQYLDFTKEWWPDSLVSELTVDGRVYMLSGDASLGLLEGLYVMFFNQDMVKSYQLSDPYDLLFDKEWTLEKYDAILKTFAQGTDVLGMEYKDNAFLSAFISSLDINITEISDEGVPVLTFGTQSVIDKTEALQNVLNTDAVKMTGMDAYTDFESQKTFSIICDLGEARKIRESNVTFKWGCVPLPMYDSEQDHYEVWMGNGFALFCIPRDATSGNESALFLEVYGQKSYEITTPAYYETALKLQYAPDETTSRVFDIIRSGADFQFGTIYANEFYQNTYTQWKVVAQNPNTSWETTYKTYQNVWKKSINELITKFRALPV